VVGGVRFSSCTRKWYSALEDGRARVWQLKVCREIIRKEVGGGESSNTQLR